MTIRKTGEEKMEVNIVDMRKAAKAVHGLINKAAAEGINLPTVDLFDITNLTYTALQQMEEDEEKKHFPKEDAAEGEDYQPHGS